jgi:hypothetical protein
MTLLFPISFLSALRENRVEIYQTSLASRNGRMLVGLAELRLCPGVRDLVPETDVVGKQVVRVGGQHPLVDAELGDVLVVVEHRPRLLHALDQRLSHGVVIQVDVELEVAQIAPVDQLVAHVDGEGVEAAGGDELDVVAELGEPGWKSEDLGERRRRRLPPAHSLRMPCSFWVLWRMAPWASYGPKQIFSDIFDRRVGTICQRPFPWD